MFLISCENTTGKSALIKSLNHEIYLDKRYCSGRTYLKLIDFNDIKGDIFELMKDKLGEIDNQNVDLYPFFFMYPELLGQTINEYINADNVVVLGHLPLNSYTKVYCVRACLEDVIDNVLSKTKLDREELSLRHTGYMTGSKAIGTLLQIEVNLMSEEYGRRHVTVLKRDEYLTSDLLKQLIEADIDIYNGVY